MTKIFYNSAVWVVFQCQWVLVISFSFFRTHFLADLGHTVHPPEIQNFQFPLSHLQFSHFPHWSVMNRSAENCRTFQIHKLKKLSKHSQEEKVLHYNAFRTGTNSLEDSLKPSHITDLWLGVISAQQQPHVTPSLFSGKYYSLISINSPDSIWIPH